MSSILDPLVERLRAVPSSQWEAIAEAAGCAKTLPRKIATRDRTNPGVNTIQPLIDFFDAVDRGEKTMPSGVGAPQRAEVADDAGLSNEPAKEGV